MDAAILKNQYIDGLWAEYNRLYDSQIFRPETLDYSILEKHVKAFSGAAVVADSCCSIFDMHTREHVWVSENYPEIFGYDMDGIEEENTGYLADRIHPDDIIPFGKYNVRFLRFILEHKSESMRYSLIINYRVDVGGRYIRTRLQDHVLELDPDGNIWLMASTHDVSPLQNPHTSEVEAKIYDKVDHVVIPVPDYPEYGVYNLDAPKLTERELEVLKLVSEGLLSKEISGRLGMSVNTVNTFRQRIIEKLGVGNTREAVRIAQRNGLI